MKEALYLSGTLNTTLGITLFQTLPKYSILLILIGLFNFLFAGRTNKEQQKDKNIILTFSIINLFLNPLSGIISLIGNEKLKKENNTTETKQKEKKEPNKLDNLLKIGVSLVSLSGIIFATTNWNIISSLTKVIVLLVFGLFFITLSIVTEKKLKLLESSKGYWLLGILFLILTVVANLYFEILPIKSLPLETSIVTIITSLLSFITYKKYNQQIYQNITFIGIITSLSMILMHFELSTTIVLTIITLLFTLINILKPNNLVNYLTYSAAIISIFGIKDPSVIEFTILTLVSITNLVTITNKKTELEGMTSPILINILIIKLISEITSNTLAIIIPLVIYSILYIIKIENKTYTKLTNIITNIALASLIIASTTDNIILLITTTAITLTSIINYEQKHEKILLPIKATTLLLSIMYVMSNYLNDIVLKLILVIIYVGIFITHKLIKNKNLKILALIMYYILFFVSLIINEENIILSILHITTSVLIFLTIEKEQNQKKSIIAYTCILITLLYTITNNYLFTQTDIANYIILLIVYIILTLVNLKNKTYKKINLCAIILPLIMITQESIDDTIINEIAGSTLGMYIIILINTYFLKQTKDKQIMTTIFIAVLIRNIIFIDSWITGLYVGIIALVLIIYGFMNKEYKGLYIEGIVIMIINIIYQLKYLWKEIPLWLYLLLSGLIIIGIVTYKELKEKK